MALQFVSSFTVWCLAVSMHPAGAESLTVEVNNNLTSFENVTISTDHEPLRDTETFPQPNTRNFTNVAADNISFPNTIDSTDLGGAELMLDRNLSFLLTNESFQNSSLFHDEDNQTKKKMDYLGMVTEPIFFVTAVVGNSLSIRVLLGKDFRKMPISLTLVCLALSDMTVTFLHPWNRPFFRDLVKLDIRSTGGDAGCKAFYWAYKTAKMTSSWFVVFVCIERFLVVWFPLKVKSISTRKKTLCGLAIIYVAIGSFTGVWTFSSGLNKDNKCVPDVRAKGMEEITAGFLLVGTTLYSGLPSALMIVFTGLIIIKLIQSHFVRKQMSTNASDKAATIRLTTMLVCITIAYIILVNPHVILHNISLALGQDFYETQNSGLKIGREVAQVMEQINYSINFYLYVLCSKEFRKRTAEVLGLHRCYSKETRNTSNSKTNFTVNPDVK